MFDPGPNPELSELFAPPGVIGDRILLSVRARRTAGPAVDRLADALSAFLGSLVPLHPLTAGSVTRVPSYTANHATRNAASSSTTSP